MANQFDNRSYEVSAPGFAERMATRLRRVGHAVTLIPFVGALVAPALTGVAAILESGSSVADGHYSKGFKQAVSGTMDTAVTGLTATAFWIPNALSALITTNTLAENAREITNWGLDAADDITGRPSRAMQRVQENIQATNMARMNQVLSAQPRTNGMVPATVAYAPEMQRQMDLQAGPNTQFTDRVAQQRGQSPEEARATFARDGDNRDHVAALSAARENQPDQSINV